MKKRRISLLLKISGLSSVLLLVSIIILSVINIQSIIESSKETSVMMGENKLMGSIYSFEYKLSQNYGKISLINNDLISEDGISLTRHYNIIDDVTNSLGIYATVFIREQNDFRRVTTNIIDSSGNRAVDTRLNNETISNIIRSGNSYIGEAIILGRDFLAIYQPLFEYGTSNVIGILFVGTEMSEIDNFISNLVKDKIFMLIIKILIILIVSVSINILFGKIVLLKPIKETNKILKHVGEGDLTKKMGIKNNDEIGEMQGYINTTIENIRHLVSTIKQEVQESEQIGQDLSANLTQTAAAVNEISANMQSIKERIIGQAASVTETKATMEQIVTNIDKLDDSIENQVSSVSQSSSAIEEMLANIQSVTQTLIKNGDNVKALLAASEVGHKGLQNVSETVNEVTKESQQLLEINRVIQDIASQTNLLSMNAAIEAAHAGDAGKGFAVVAEEIRKLADSSSQQSNVIKSVLKKIMSDINSVTTLVSDVLTKFEIVDDNVKTVAEQEDSIRCSMEEQSVGSKQILESIGKVNEVSQQVKHGSKEMQEGSSEVIRESQDLERVTHEISSNINEMAAGVNQINTAVHQISELGAKNKEQTKILLDEISKFTI